MAWPTGLAGAGVSMKKCRCPVASAAGLPAGMSVQFWTSTSTLTFGPLTVAPSAGDVMLIVAGGDMLQAASKSARPSSIDARIGVRVYRSTIIDLLLLFSYGYAKECDEGRRLSASSSVGRRSSQQLPPAYNAVAPK